MVSERLSSIASILEVVAGSVEVTIWSYVNIPLPFSSSTGIYNAARTFAQWNTKSLITNCLGRVQVDIEKVLSTVRGFLCFLGESVHINTYISFTYCASRCTRCYLTPVPAMRGLRKLCAAQNGASTKLVGLFLTY